jgi:hypothetical protein
LPVPILLWVITDASVAEAVARLSGLLSDFAMVEAQPFAAVLGEDPELTSAIEATGIPQLVDAAARADGLSVGWQQPRTAA